MCDGLPGSGLNSGHHGGHGRRRRRERKWKEREISAASAQSHSDGWSLEPAILNPLEGHFFTFPYKSPDKLFTSCSSTQHDICAQAFVCLLRPAFDKPHCTDPIRSYLWRVTLANNPLYHCFAGFRDAPYRQNYSYCFYSKTVIAWIWLEQFRKIMVFDNAHLCCC